MVYLCVCVYFVGTTSIADVVLSFVKKLREVVVTVEPVFQQNSGVGTTRITDVLLSLTLELKI